MILCIILMIGYPMTGFMDIVLNWIINCVFYKGLGSFYRQNSTEFSIDFRVLQYFRIVCSLDRVGILIFQIGCNIRMPYGFLVSFREIETHSRTHDDCHVSTFGAGCDNFIGIRTINFLNLPSIFTNPVDIGCILVFVYVVSKSKQLSLFEDKITIPPRKGYSQPRKALVDEEAASTPHAPLPQEEPQVLPKFQVSSMP